MFTLIAAQMSASDPRRTSKARHATAAVSLCRLRRIKCGTNWFAHVGQLEVSCYDAVLHSRYGALVIWVRKTSIFDQ